MNGKLTKTLGYTLLATGLAVAAVPVSADNLSAERAQRLVFTPQNDANVAEISINEELTFRVDGLNLNAKFVHGVDISACSVSRINPGENVLATAEVTDAKNGVIRVKAGPAAGRAKLHLKCRSKQVSIMVRVS